MSETAKPRPQGRYLPVKRHGDMIFVSGMTPRMNGKLLYVGKLASDGPAEVYRLTVDLATRNAVQAALSELRSDECLASVLSPTVYVNAPHRLLSPLRYRGFASLLPVSVIGEGGIPRRVAVGVASLLRPQAAWALRATRNPTVCMMTDLMDKQWGGESGSQTHDFRSFHFEQLRVLVSTRPPPPLENADATHAPQARSHWLW